MCERFNVRERAHIQQPTELFVTNCVDADLLVNTHCEFYRFQSTSWPLIYFKYTTMTFLSFSFRCGVENFAIDCLEFVRMFTGNIKFSNRQQQVAGAIVDLTVNDENRQIAGSNWHIFWVTANLLSFVWILFVSGAIRRWVVHYSEMRENIFSLTIQYVKVSTMHERKRLSLSRSRLTVTQLEREHNHWPFGRSM